jgi:hypothetical protein
MICINCGRKMKPPRKPPEIHFSGRCYSCGFRYEIDPRCGPRHTHIWTDANGSIIDVPWGCLLVVSWDEEEA